MFFATRLYVLYEGWWCSGQPTSLVFGRSRVRFRGLSLITQRSCSIMITHHLSTGVEPTSETLFIEYTSDHVNIKHILINAFKLKEGAFIADSVEALLSNLIIKQSSSSCTQRRSRLEVVAVTYFLSLQLHPRVSQTALTDRTCV
jgi:hypothetical protein